MATHRETHQQYRCVYFPVGVLPRLDRLVGAIEQRQGIPGVRGASVNALVAEAVRRLLATEEPRFGLKPMVETGRKGPR